MTLPGAEVVTITGSMHLPALNRLLDQRPQASSWMKNKGKGLMEGCLASEQVVVL
jgi:hypothetical protein